MSTNYEATATDALRAMRYEHLPWGTGVWSTDLVGAPAEGVEDCRLATPPDRHPLRPASAEVGGVSVQIHSPAATSLVDCAARRRSYSADPVKINTLVELYTAVSPLTLKRQIDRRLAAMPLAIGRAAGA